MILSNSSIFQALDDGRLIIEPEPTPRESKVGGESSPFGTTSVDLKLSNRLQIPKKGLSISIALSEEEENISETLATLSTPLEIDSSQGYKLIPKELVLGQTQERIVLPLPEEPPTYSKMKACLAARVEGKSSRARFGILVHFTAPTIHAGWDGQLTLEMMNLGTAPFTLFPGMAICQLIIEEVDGIPTPAPSQFQNQQAPTGES